ncbi:MAG TPA: NADH-quinone oxidoreductase subunit K [Verrucomicrobiota bacterium]|nr:Na(+)/H(+) antiporter subunit C [Verrucomicrobiales bacterium]HRI11860.1 NADH-quinone oxidoreductase subunit K [Verrucomicrobiota bacterium]
MQLDTSLLVGVLFTCGTYLVLQRSFVKIVFGFIILSNAANLLILAMSGSPVGKVSPLMSGAAGPRVDPLPQALILTAIVIGFGVTAYLIVLLYRLFLDHQTTNAADLYSPDPGRPEDAP